MVSVVAAVLAIDPAFVLTTAAVEHRAEKWAGAAVEAGGLEAVEDERAEA